MDRLAREMKNYYGIHIDYLINDDFWTRRHNWMTDVQTDQFFLSSFIMFYLRQTFAGKSWSVNLWRNTSLTCIKEWKGLSNSIARNVSCHSLIKASGRNTTKSNILRRTLKKAVQSVGKLLPPLKDWKRTSKVFTWGSGTSRNFVICWRRWRKPSQWR